MAMQSTKDSSVETVGAVAQTLETWGRTDVVLNISPIDWTAPSWTRFTLTHDQVIKWTKAKVHVYTDSVLCMGKTREHPEAHQRWNAQLGEFQQSNSYRELFGIDGEPIELEWNIFP